MAFVKQGGGMGLLEFADACSRCAFLALGVSLLFSVTDEAVCAKVAVFFSVFQPYTLHSHPYTLIPTP